MEKALERDEGPLLRYAARYVGDVERARDVVQDTFLALCRTRPSEVDGHLGAWLFTVCRNRALDVCRKERRMEPLNSEDRSAVTTMASPAARIEGVEETARILAAVESLPGAQREVIRLKFQEGLRYQEISEVTGLSVSNVGFLIHTAMKNLRQKLAQKS